MSYDHEHRHDDRPDPEPIDRPALRDVEDDEVYDRVCILTNADGENPDDCTTHLHEGEEA